MNYLKQGVLLGCSLLALAACNEAQWEGPAGHGGIALHLTTSPDVKEARSATRADEQPFELPEVEDFSISLTKIDNSYTRTWETLSDFEAEEGFAVGAYTISAFYGDMENEGFESPYFEGSSEVNVLDGHEAEVNLTASLQNTMVSVEYTDEFKSFFKAFTTTFHSEGHGYVDYPGTETRPVFVAPGAVEVTVDVTTHRGESTRMKVAAFEARPGYHHRLRLNVNGGNIGESTLHIEFDETVVAENVTIDLTEELFATKAPAINVEGMGENNYLDIMANTMPENPVKISALAYGGLQSAKLTVQSTTWDVPFGTGDIELVNASKELQDELAAYGIKGIGFYSNPDRMAVLDLTSLPLHLPDGRHTLSLTITDELGRVSEPAVVTFDSSPVTVNVSPVDMMFADTKARLKVEYNGADPEKDLTFEAQDDYGNYVPSQIVDVTEQTRTRALAPRTYIYTITVPESTRASVPVRVSRNGRVVQELTVSATFPEYSVELDPMATSMRVRVKASDETLTPTVVRHLRLFMGDADGMTITRDVDNGMVTVKGLTAGTAYRAQFTLHPEDTPEMDHTIDISTEAATDVPNGDFTALTETINKRIDAGGPYQYMATHMTNHTQLVVSEPDGWCSINAKTAWDNSNPYNTWFVVPSTMSVTGGILLRSVAYDHAGTLPANDNHGAAVRAKYSRNKPSSWSSYAAGELFLGTYSYTGEEHRTDGIAFTSRPASMTVNYEYVPVNGEKGIAVIEVLDASGKVIASKTQELVSGSRRETLRLPEYAFGSKAASLRVGFKSSTAETPAAPVPDDIADVSNTTGLSGQTIPTNQYKSLCTGSRLTLKSVHLNY